MLPRLHLPLDRRASGVLLHVTSLPSPYGIGDFGPAAFRGSTASHRPAKAGGNRYRSVPPGTATRPTNLCRLSLLNALVISPDWLIEDELLKPSEAAAHPAFLGAPSITTRVTPFKYGLMKKLGTISRLARDLICDPAYEQFCERPGSLARRLCAFPRAESQI